MLKKDFNLNSYTMKENQLNELDYKIDIVDNKFSEFDLISNSKVSLGIDFNKHYKFSSNDLTLNIKIKNTSLKKKMFKYGLEIPLSFYPFENNINISLNEDALTKEDIKVYDNIHLLRMNDKKHKTKIGINFNEPCNLFYDNSYLKTRTVLGEENLYQFSLFVPTWDIVLESYQEIDLNITLRIGRNIL